MEQEIYDYNSSLKESTKYFNGDKLAAKVFLDKYALRDNKQNLLENTPDKMHVRMATELARIEKKKFKNPMSFEEILSYIQNFKKIVPQGSLMYGIGNPYQFVTLSNCFVVAPPLDSYSGILHTDQQMVQICKRRGGVGTDISNLRPDGTPTTNAARTSTGIISFMERYSNSIREVAQNGRRGAMLLSISVHHPEILKFTKVKRDLTRVTGANISIKLTNEFLEAVNKNKEYEIRWPVDSKNPKISRMVNARDVWRQIVENARNSGEPGLLFWDKILEESPADCYSKYGFTTTGTNPCFSGDTLIAVADGRNAVSLKDLAKEGMDVPVYSVNPNNGEISIKWGRNPRKTGVNKQMVRVHFDNGSHIDVTHDHKFPLKTGETREAKELKSGDSLFKFIKRPEKIVKTNKKEYYRTYCNALNSKKDKIYEHRLIAKFMDTDKWNTLYDINKQDGWVKGGIVVHHKDYDGLNNDPNNLDIMTFSEHKEYHAKKDNSGEKNGRYSGYTNKDIEQFAITLTKKINRRFTKNDWFNFVKDKKIPKRLSSFRTNGWFKNILDLAKWDANECGIEHADKDPRVVKTFQKATKQRYDARIDQNKVKVIRKCEWCGNSFEVDYSHREISFCSISCSNYHANEKGTNKTRTNSINNTYEKKAIKTRNDQVRIYSKLTFDNPIKNPSLKEWENACKKENVSFRLRTKYGFKNLTEIKELAADYNHKVTKIEYITKKQDVYNITVDDNHTVGVITDIRKNKSGNDIFDGIFALQCGEVPLSPCDSCRLLLLNLFSYVIDPFTKNAKFDFEQFHKDAQVAQRFMENVIDLELECIDKIIDKIDKDPEPEAIKLVELSLWREIREVCETGRRTGTGTTGLGDTLAALGLDYGSKQGIKTAEKIYRTLKLGCYRSSVDMAKELGPFKIWGYNLEKNNPFLLRIKEEDPELYKDMRKYGRRNIGLLTSAPAGSVSILTQTTSGIEPLFQMEYKRRKKINPSDKNTRVDFVDQNGDSWEEFTVYHSKVKMWMDVTGETDITKSPWFGACAEDIDWKRRIQMQAAAGRNLDHSISSTINLKEETTTEEVADIYEAAWKAGLKGITVYRENSRTGVLIANDSNCIPRDADNIDKHDAPKRPKVLPCDIYHISVKGQDYLTVVGLLSDDPYEIFALKNGQIPKAHKTGMLKKVKRGHYKLITSEGAEIENIMDESGDMEEAITRLVSSNLRHGADISFVVEQLEKTKSASFGSFEKAIARSLKKYIDDGKKVNGEECEECGNELIREQGCKMCKNCGFSACN